MLESIEGFRYVKVTAKVSPRSLKEDDQNSVSKARRSPVDRSLRKPYWQSERRLWADRCLIIFFLSNVGNQSYRAAVRRIAAVTLIRDRLNVSKLPARKIGRSRETQTKEFYQEMSEFRSTVFENNGRDSIQTASLLKIKAREGIGNVIMKIFNFKDEVVRGCRSRKNMPSIIQSRVGSKGLSEEFSFKERRNSCGAIWLK